MRGGRSSRPAKRRRTQAERSAETRAKLMAAAVASLLERGYAGTTTTELAKRAGVSRGAQVHHFPTKAELVTHAVKHLADRWIHEFQRVKRTLPPGGDRSSAVIDLVWSSFSGDLFMAAIELWVAARTDRALHATVLAAERETGRSIAECFEEAFGEAAAHPRFQDLRRLTLSLIRGMALESILEPRDRRRRAALELWKQLAAAALEKERGAGAGRRAPRDANPTA